jgi:hypothetical protein
MNKTENISNKMWQKIICCAYREYSATVIKASRDTRSTYLVICLIFTKLLIRKYVIILKNKIIRPTVKVTVLNVPAFAKSQPETLPNSLKKNRAINVRYQSH